MYPVPKLHFGLQTIRRAVLTVALGALAVTPARAETSPLLAASEYAGADTIVFLLDPRDRDDVNDDLRRTEQMAVDAGRDRARAEFERAEARIQVDVMDQEMRFVDEERRRLEQERNRTEDETLRRQLENERRDLQDKKEGLERRKRFFEAEADLANAVRELAESRERLARANMELYRRELQLTITTDAGRPEVEKEVLEARKTALERAEDATNREKRLVERQLTVLDRAKDIRENG